MSEESKSNQSWVLFALFLVFLALKLGEYIDWSWWFVTIPLWIGTALTLAGVIGAAAFLVATACFVLFLEYLDSRGRK